MLSIFGYTISRETGSHLRLTSNLMGHRHDITIPDHHVLKIGTLNKISKDVAEHLKISKDQLIKELFGK